jgi:hypothetical protein
MSAVDLFLNESGDWGWFGGMNGGLAAELR